LSSRAVRKAVVFAEYFPPYMSSDRRLLHLIEGLKHWDCDVIVTPPLRCMTGLCEDALKGYADNFAPPAKHFEAGAIHGTYLVLPRLIHRLFPKHILLLPLAYALTIPILTIESIRVLKERKPELVVIGHPSFITGLVGSLAARYCRIPILLDYPDAWTPLALETAGVRQGGFLERALRMIEGFVARSATGVVSITDALSNYIRALRVKAPITTISNGADVELFSPPARRPPRRNNAPYSILYTGRLEAWAGIDHLAPAIARVADRLGDRAEFVFVGDGGAAKRFKAELRELGLDRLCRFEGYRPYSEMPEFVASCDLAILPFPNTATTRPSSPLKLFEYMAMAKPVIATDLPGVREAVNDEVVLIRDLDDPALVEAIVRLIDDPHERERRGAAGRALVMSRFSWPSLGARFELEMDRVADSVAAFAPTAHAPIARVVEPPIALEISADRAMIVLPTYDEIENLTPLLDAVIAASDRVDIVVVDDNSPDGTGVVADAYSHATSRVHVVHRPMKLGLGSAYHTGFRHARRLGYGMIGSIDADMSHDPARLVAMLACVDDGADIVIGSRYIAGGRTQGWPIWRKLHSRLANAFIRTALRLPVHDCTSGYRLYRSSVYDGLESAGLFSQGFDALVEIIHRATRTGAVIVEVPITFTDRHNGASKMGPREMAGSLGTILRLCTERPRSVRRFVRDEHPVVAAQPANGEGVSADTVSRDGHVVVRAIIDDL
jgi:dolichol-phosphate mannosyltransferase